jgi:transposase
MKPGFIRLSMAVRTWAPRGQTPLLRVKLTRDHLIARSAVSRSMGDCSCKYAPTRMMPKPSSVSCGYSYARCAGKIVLIWDGSPIHRAHEIKDFLKRGAAKRLHLEQLPGYAPDLNPDEGIWNYLKRVELGNVCCANLEQLHHALIRAKERLRHKKEIITSCSRQCGYSV